MISLEKYGFPEIPPAYFAKYGRGKAGYATAGLQVGPGLYLGTVCPISNSQTRLAGAVSLRFGLPTPGECVQAIEIIAFLV
jgi:hypothetical protein